MEMAFHEAACIFPMDDETLDTLAKDIKRNGQAVAIEIQDGKVIDGRRRWLACKIAGIKPITREVQVADPVAYVLSLNLHRRHLTPSQWSMVGAKAEALNEKFAAEAKERMKAGARNKGVENLPHPEKTRDAIGKSVGVSGKSIDYAKRVLEQGIPELAVAVESGRMAVSTAALLATEPPEKQLKEVNQPKRNRRYGPGGGGAVVNGIEEPEEEQPEGERRGVGVIRANEAVNCLIRIPKNDALRKRGFQIVTDWIRKNK